MTMIIKELKLAGFRSYYMESKAAFTEGVNVVVGRNGAGKSSIIEAIYFALTGEPLRGRKEELVNFRKKSLSVELRMTYDKGELVIAREWPESVRDVLRLDGSLLAMGTTGVQSKLAELVGLPRHKTELGGVLERLLRTALIPQGGLLEIADLLSRPVAKTKEWVDTQLGLKDYETAWQRLGEYEIKVSDVESKLLSGFKLSFKVNEVGLKAMAEVLHRVDRLVEDFSGRVKALEREVSTLRSRAEELQKRREKLAKDLEEFEKKLAELRAKRERFMVLTERKTLLKQRIDALTRRLEELEKRMSALTMEGITEELVNEIERLRVLAEEGLRYKRLFDRLKVIELLVTEVESAYYSLGDLTRKCANVIDCINKLKEQLIRAESLIREQRTLTEELHRLLNEAKRTIAELASGLAIKVSIEPTVETLDEVLEELTGAIERLKGEEASVRAQLLLIENRIVELEKATGRCPLCGALLTEDRRKKLVAELNSSAVKLRERLQDIARTLQTSEESLRRLTRIYVQISEARTKAGMIATAAEEAIKQLTEVGDIEEVKSTIRTLESVTQRVAALNIMLEKEELSAFGFKLPKLDITDLPRTLSSHKSALSFMIDQTLRRIEEFEKTLRSLAMGLATDIRARLLEAWSSGDETTFRLLAYGLYDKLEEYRRLHETIRELEKEKRMLEKELSLLDEDLMRLAYDEKEHTRLEEQSKSLEIEFRKIESELQKILGELKEKEIKLEEEKTELGRLINDRTRLKEAQGKLVNLLKVRTLFHRDGIPSKLRAYAISRLNEELNQMLQLFNLSYKEALVAEDLSVILKSSAGSVSMSQLSGGESIVVALSFLLALRRTVEELLVGKRIFGFLILDEPTVHLDEERRASLVELLKWFQGGRIIPQLIIVTHEEDLKESGDNILMVEYDGNTSRIIPYEGERY